MLKRTRAVWKLTSFKIFDCPVLPLIFVVSTLLTNQLRPDAILDLRPETLDQIVGAAESLPYDLKKAIILASAGKFFENIIPIYHPEV